ncbi:IS21 family transposase, partial [Lactococcus garvieae]
MASWAIIPREYASLQLDWIHAELKKKGVTLSLLHKEYEKSAKREGKLAYSYRSFSRKYTYHGRKYQLTMPIKKKPGEVMEVDWAGTTVSLMDRITGQPLKVYVFVANLPFSMMIYAEAVLDMKSENWLNCHIHAYEAFGGVTESLIPDNLKTGVIKAHNVDPVLNE